MTRETRIGLLVGLGFIVMFGLVLTELTGTGKPASLPVPIKDGANELAMATPLEDISPTVVNPLDTPPRLGQAFPSPTPSTGTPLMASTPQTPTASSLLPPPRPEPEVVAVVHRTGDTSPTATAPPAASALQPPKVTPATDVTPLTSAPEPPPVRTYTVQPKDSLIKIAGKVYGADRQEDYRRILEANKDKIKNPSLLAVGQELVIPELGVKLPAVSSGSADVQQVDLDHLAKALTPGDSDTDKAEPAKEAKPAAKNTYVVQRGDTLSKIAQDLEGRLAGGRHENRGRQQRQAVPSRPPAGGIEAGDSKLAEGALPLRLAIVIVTLAAMAVGLVHIRRAELIARHESQQFQLRQVTLRRRLWDQQIALSYLTAPAEVRRRSEELCLGLVEKDRSAMKATDKAHNRSAPTKRP